MKFRLTKYYIVLMLLLLSGLLKPLKAQQDVQFS